MLEALVKFDLQKSKELLFLLKKRAEETNNPELFELCYQVAESNKAIIKTIHELARAYATQLNELATYDLQSNTTHEELKKDAARLLNYAQRLARENNCLRKAYLWELESSMALIDLLQQKFKA